MLDVSTREYKNERIRELLSIDISLYQLDTIDERLLLYVETDGYVCFPSI